MKTKLLSIMIMITLSMNITLLMWKQFIVFESLMILPLFRMRRILLMWRVIKFLCLWIMKRVIYVIVILLNSFMMIQKIIMREEHMLVGIAIIPSFLSMCLKFWSYTCFTFLCKLILISISCLITKSLGIGSGLDLNVLAMCFMMLSLRFNSYLLCEHHWNHHA